MTGGRPGNLPPGGRVVPHMTHDLVATLRPLLAAEASAEAHASGADSGDLEQAVWLRLLERLGTDGPPADPAAWLRGAVRSEARRTRHTASVELPYASEPADDSGPGPEQLALTAARRRALHAAVRRLPGRCPRLMAALLSPMTSHTGRSRGSWVSHREVSVRNVPDAWDVCAECSRRRLRRVNRGDRSEGQPAEQVSGRHAHMGMSVTISAATEQDAEQILKLQFLCYQSEAELYGNYRIEPLAQTLDSLKCGARGRQSWWPGWATRWWPRCAARWTRMARPRSTS